MSAASSRASTGADDKAASSERPEPATDEIPRTIGLLSLAALTFFTISSGPYGLEDAVGAAGALPVLIGILTLSVVWGLPQALVTAELSCLMDVNGGYVEWVHRGLGPFAAWVSAFNTMCSNISDLPLYTVLFSSYMTPLLESWVGHDLNWGEEYLVKLACLLVIFVLNLRGIEDVGRVSTLITVLILAPFVIEPIKDADILRPRNWGITADPIDWGTFASVLLWNFQGWDALGSVAGEVKNAKVTYPLGIFLALIVITVSYAVPVMYGISVDPDYSNWEDGYFADLASHAGDWVHIWVVAGAIVAQIGNGLAMMAASSRAAWQMSHKGMLPRAMGTIWTRYNSPAVGVVFHTITTAVLMTLPFSVLIVIDTLFNNVGLLLEGVAFLVLRYTEPDTYRPYTVPGGRPVAWLITILKFGVIGFAAATADPLAWWFAGVGNVVFVLAYFLKRWYVRRFHPDDAENGEAVLPDPPHATHAPPDHEPSEDSYLLKRGGGGGGKGGGASGSSSSQSTSSEESGAVRSTHTPPPKRRQHVVDESSARVAGGHGLTLHVSADDGDEADLARRSTDLRTPILLHHPRDDPLDSNAAAAAPAAAAAESRASRVTTAPESSWVDRLFPAWLTGSVAPSGSAHYIAVERDLTIDEPQVVADAVLTAHDAETPMPSRRLSSHAGSSSASSASATNEPGTVGSVSFTPRLAPIQMEMSVADISSAAGGGAASGAGRSSTPIGATRGRLEPAARRH